MNRILTYCLILLASLSGVELFAQASADEYDDIEVTLQMDTIVTTRSNGSWWYGAQGGFSYYQGLGTLYTLYADAQVGFDNALENGVSFTGGTGWGINYGLVGEWVEPGSFFSAALRIDYEMVMNVNDDSDIQTNLGESAANANFYHDSQFSFVTISPSLRYNLAESGFHLLGGLNIGIPIYENAVIGRQGINETADLDNGLSFNYNSENATNGIDTTLGNYELVRTNWGLHFGVGYDYMLGDVFGVGRLKATPFAIVNYDFGVASGSLPEPFNDVESNLSLASARAGLQVKFAYDNISRDTLPFDPNYAPPPVVAIDLIEEQSIDFTGFLKPKTVNPEEISYIETSNVKGQIAENAFINTERPEDEPTDIAEVPQEPKFDIKVGIDKTFNYPSTNQTGPTREMREYLDEVANYHRENPNQLLLLVAHTDNTGSSAEQTERAKQRLERAKSYLISKGVNAGVIIDENNAGRRPITSNRTAEGRRQNRRLTIRVLPARSRR